MFRRFDSRLQVACAFMGVVLNFVGVGGRFLFGKFPLPGMETDLW